MYRNSRRMDIRGISSHVYLQLGELVNHPTSSKLFQVKDSLRNSLEMFGGLKTTLIVACTDDFIGRGWQYS